MAQMEQDPGLVALPSTYDPRTVLLHWLTAALVAALWCVAEVIDDFSPGPNRVAVRSLHIVLGILLACLVVVRVVWRMRSGRHLPAANPGLMGGIEKSAHLLLYAGLVAVLLLGMSNAWIRGDSLFNLFRIPRPQGALHDLKATVETLHKYFANGLVIFAGCHALTALYHQFVLKDGVLARMRNGPARPSHGRAESGR